MEVSSISFLYFISTITLGLLSPIETYTSFYLGRDSENTKHPMVSFGANHYLNDFHLFVEHQSSPMTLEDEGLNHLGLKYKFNNNFYIGSSKKINYCNSCTDNISVIGGYEKENLFFEYSYNRVYSGIKFLF